MSDLPKVSKTPDYGKVVTLRTEGDEVFEGTLEYVNESTGYWRLTNASRIGERFGEVYKMYTSSAIAGRNLKHYVVS